jgi:hypothetical protein
MLDGMIVETLKIPCMHHANINWGSDVPSAPVMATSGMTGVLKARETMAVTIVQPADGPSLGTAPCGTCRCTVPSSRALFLGSIDRTRWREYVCAIFVDSLNTSPSCPAASVVLWKWQVYTHAPDGKAQHCKGEGSRCTMRKVQMQKV